ncbi:MAG: SIS domain-containing protein, partial [Actinobacteria bacterium]|nr:SIS domain-containing protein [Actinomycetota bacterium]
LAVTNVVGSSLSRDADGVLYTRAGQEVGVAATKTFLAQLVALDLLALRMAGDHAMLAAEEEERLIAVVGGLPELVRAALERGDEIESVAEKLSGSKDFFFLGRHVGYPVALEGALKLKEIAYLRAEGFAAGELKHGPIALIRPGSIVVGVATRNPLWPKMMSNVAEVKARGATVVLVAEDGDLETQEQADHVLGVPAVAEPLFSPVVDAIPLQLLAYWLSRLAGHDVDRPRNLAKTVTVE